MKISKYLVLIVLALFYSCKEKNEKPIIQIEPESLILYGVPGDVISWNISASSEVKLARLLIRIQPENDFQTTYLDTLLYSKTLTLFFQYKIPAAYAGKLIYFNFTVIDEDGNEAVGLKELQVGDQLLTEQTGLQFFIRSHLSNAAFDLEGTQSVASFADSSLRDIQEFTADTLSENPTSKWFSPAGGKFVKANNFDYANATLLSAKNLFDGSIQMDITDSLIPNDILITKLGSNNLEKFVVIKFVSVTNVPGNNLDTYTFNIKK
jgi:hypothetical protein